MRKEISEIREIMSKNSCDAYIIPTSDFHGSEYVNDYFEFRRYASGFTGSAGTLLITEKEADLWTDGRYFLQAAEELKNSGITLQKMGMPETLSLTDYIKRVLKKGQTLAFDGRTMPFADGKDIAAAAEESDLILKTDLDIATLVWHDRPELKSSKIFELPASSCGKSHEEKLAELRKAMKAEDATHIVICRLEENAWLYNLRASDIGGTPVFFSYSLISHDSEVLYAFPDAFKESVLPEGVTLKPYIEGDKLAIFEDLAKLPADASVLIDPATCSYALYDAIKKVCDVKLKTSPLAYMKSVKNEKEIESTRLTHIDDGLAVTKFIHYLKNNAKTGTLTEISASDYLLSLRKEAKDFLEESFDTISGYGPNGAIIHYSATPETNAAIKPEGFLLVDSGGQYLRGTTDITRTISVGPLTEKMKKCYTAVLKANLQLAMTKFTKDTPGTELDEIARKPIREIGYDYNHGTGHGVGHVLCVHEGPNVINLRKKTSDIVSGTITTDEPGIYIEGEFGIRLENELLCKKFDNEGTLCFEPLTLCPFDRDAIIKEMLTEQELEYLNDYHKIVYDTLAPLLNVEEKEFLYKETAKL